jgi:hypothetical protein
MKVCAAAWFSALEWALTASAALRMRTEVVRLAAVASGNG